MFTSKEILQLNDLIDPNASYETIPEVHQITIGQKRANVYSQIIMRNLKDKVIHITAYDADIDTLTAVLDRVVRSVGDRNVRFRKDSTDFMNEEMVRTVIIHRPGLLRVEEDSLDEEDPKPKTKARKKTTTKSTKDEKEEDN